VSEHPVPDGPPRGWRLAVFRLCRLVAVGASRAYLPGRVAGRQHLPAEGPYILAPVHRSYVDWLVVARVTRRRLRYITKDEVFRWAWLSRFIQLLGAFPVHRGTADREAFKRSIGALEGGEPLVLFPEGTRRSGLTVEPVLDGAAYLALRAGVPIVPVGIGGSERRMPRGSAFPRPGRVSIVIGEPLRPPGQGTPVAGAAASAPSHAGRVSRTATRALSAELRARIQECFDRAQQELGLAVATAEQLAEAGIAGAARDQHHTLLEGARTDADVAGGGSDSPGIVVDGEPGAPEEGN
jgi:1-acyl-sn-glycerol-3-phosphate acyltransferase